MGRRLTRKRERRQVRRVAERAARRFRELFSTVPSEPTLDDAADEPGVSAYASRDGRSARV